MDNLSHKLIASVTIISIVVQIFDPVVFAVSEFAPYARTLATLGIINPQSSDIWYHLGEFITRAEIVKIAVNVEKSSASRCSEQIFTDVDATLGSLCGYIEAAANLGIVSKASLLFRPADLVTRAEMLKVLLNAGGTSPSENPSRFLDLPTSLWDLTGYINAATEIGCINQWPLFHPNSTSTRGELFKVANCIVQMKTTMLTDSGYTLRWSDEFDGAALDMKKWTIETGADGWGNHELQDYTNGENIAIESGKLVIEARKEPSNGATYTSSRIMTHGKFAQRYGRIEARIKLPYGQGMWPAFWMLGENIDTVGYPTCGEIDIMEMAGGISNEDGVSRRESIIEWSLHRPNQDPHQMGVVKSLSAPYINKYGGKFSDDFHVFGIDWDEKAIRYSVDGIVYQSIDISSRTDGFEVFQKPFYIVLNLAIGGDFPGSPDVTTTWPQRMMVDWVRVYGK